MEGMEAVSKVQQANVEEKTLSRTLAQVQAWEGQPLQLQQQLQADGLGEWALKKLSAHSFRELVEELSGVWR